MSRAFTKEGDQQELPIIPPRAALPEGVPNYVTPLGLQLLIEEQQELEKEQVLLSKEGTPEAKRTLIVTDIKLRMVNQRISNAKEIDLSKQPKEEVRFGATVTLKMKKQEMSQTFQIVGIDEANIKLNKIAFVAPLAKAIMGKKKGETTLFPMGDEMREVKIFKISYE